MRHSRSISDLRADVAENCRALLMLAEREGLSVLVTETVRDQRSGDAVVPRRACRIGL